MKVLVLGCGLVGKAIVRDLAEAGDLSLTVVDARTEALAEVEGENNVQTSTADLTEPGTANRLALDHDLVVGAVPGWLGFSMLREVLEAGKPLVDISFMPEDPFKLDDLAREKGVPALVDCGVAPGLSNLFVGRAKARFDALDEVRIMVGGLPVVRRLPYEYAVVFSPSDVLEEYTRPALVVESGKVVSRPPLSELELVEVGGVGTLEAFLTDGLRTLRRTINAPFMKEKTLRYPGHCDRIRLLKDTGLLSEEPVTVGDVTLKPRDLTAQLLAESWQLGPHEEDLTVLHVDVGGTMDGRAVRYLANMVDVFDSEKGVTSMARTTGYTCTAVVRLLASGAIKMSGVVPLENLGSDEGLSEGILDYLEERDVHVEEDEVEMDEGE